MVRLKIKIPTYKSDDFHTYSHPGELEISAEVDSLALSEGYQDLKLKLDELLRSIGAENQIVLDLASLHKKVVSQKTTLRRLEERIVDAKEQLQKLEAFLQLLGISPTGYSLSIDNKVLRPILKAQSTEVKVEVDPISFDEDSEDEDSEDEDSEDEDSEDEDY